MYVYQIVHPTGMIFVLWVFNKYLNHIRVAGMVEADVC